MNKLKTQNAITLIALVITIIVLLILAGISIAALTNQGLFAKANEAKQKMDDATINQAKILNEYEDELKKYIPGQSEEKLVDKVNDGTIKIGDYVKYKPDELKNDILQTLKDNLKNYSGKSDSEANSVIQRDELTWRVLDVKDGQVRLISSTPTKSLITLYGYNGYNNAVKLLDDACRTLYNSSLASEVQNIKIEDIQNKMKTDYKTLDPKYGTMLSPSNKFYLSILLKEKDQKITIDKETITGNELDLSEQENLINQTEKLQATALNVKYTYWYKMMESTDFYNDKYYEIFINNGSNYETYWMSSRCIAGDSGIAYFNIFRFDNEGFVGAGHVYNSSDDERPDDYAFRPVITLNSNVQLDKINSGNGSTAEQGYAIK